MNFTIRLMERKDIDSITAFIEHLEIQHSNALPHIFRKPIDPTHIYTYLDAALEQSSPTLFVAAADDEPIILGFIEVLVIQESSNPMLVDREYALIDKLLVDETYRNLGIGKQLIRAAEDWLHSKQIVDVELYVWEFNAGARQLYEGSGYETMCRRMSKRIDR